MESTQLENLKFIREQLDEYLRVNTWDQDEIWRALSDADILLGKAEVMIRFKIGLKTKSRCMRCEGENVSEHAWDCYAK